MGIEQKNKQIPESQSSNVLIGYTEAVRRYLLIEERWKALQTACKMSRNVIEEKGRKALKGSESSWILGTVVD